MNKFKKTGVLILLASGMAFAAGSLWNAAVPYGIVHFPWVIECLDDPEFDESDSEDPCFKEHGGWWWGFVAGAPDGKFEGYNLGVVGTDTYNCKGPLSTADPYKSAINYVKAVIDDEVVSFVGPDYSSCEGPDVTDRSDGRPKLDGALEVELNIGSGILKGGPSSDIYEPSIAAIGVNLSAATDDSRNPPPLERDMTYGDTRDGFCLKYISDLDVNGPDQTEPTFELELGWDESAADNGAWDSWTAPIPVGVDTQKVDFRWSNTSTGNSTTGYTSGDFKQAGYSGALRRDIQEATKKMKAVKIVLKGYTPKTVNFKLIEFGWAGECSGPNPIISKNENGNNLNLSLQNRMLSMTVKSPASVQIFNLQGAVVHNQVYVPGSKMNLNNLPTGVYMVRVPSQGYSGKIMLK